MLQVKLLTDAHNKALNILHSCVTPYGYRASGLAAGYPQVWARDSAITFLGATATGDETLFAAGRAALETLGKFQSNRGLIPLNVNPDSGYVSTENAGSVDSNLWFILGHYLHYQYTGDTAFRPAALAHHRQGHVLARLPGHERVRPARNPRSRRLDGSAGGALQRALRQRALLCRQGGPCRAGAPAASQARRSTSGDVDAAGVHGRLNLLMWIDRCWVAEHFAEHLEKLKRIRLEWFMLYHNMGTISSRPFYLPWVAFREYGDWCDSLGNLLAILTGVADGHRREHILRFMQQVGMAEPYPTKAIYPPIFPGESNWRDYYRSRNLNLPHQYHNGGIWPLIGGFHVAALVRHGWQHQAEQMLISLAEANRQGTLYDWTFNEWLHGSSGHPMGYEQQAWSAAMFLYAENAVRTGKLPLFDELLAAKPAAAVAAEDNEYHVAGGGGPA